MGQQAYPTDKSEDIFGVLRSSVLCVRLIICSFSWIAANMGFFGLTFSASNLSGNFYLNFLLSMVAEVPSYLIGIFVMNRYGRRITLSGGLLLSGLACLITGLVPEGEAFNHFDDSREPPTKIVALFSITFNVVFEFEGEL